MLSTNSKEPRIAESAKDTANSEASQRHETIILQRAAYRWRTSWQAPATMIGLLLVGGALALGHHFFYESLRDTETPDNFSQQLNTAYGTAFAFLAKAALIGAVASAYTQYMWFSFRAEFATVSAIDAKFSALSSIFSVLDFNLLLRPQTGFLLAIIAWLLPIAAIVTPATLAVRQAQNLTTTPMNVPNVNFSSLPTPSPRTATSTRLDRLAVLVTSGVQIPPIPAFLPNATYSVELLGPSLRCGEPSNKILGRIDDAFLHLNNVTQAYNINGSLATPLPNAVYMGFSPSTINLPVWPFDATDQPVSTVTDWEAFIDFCLKGSAPCSFTDPVIFGRSSDNAGGRGEPTDTSNALWLRLGQTRLVCSIQKTQYKIDFDTRQSSTPLSNYTFTTQGVFNVSRTLGMSDDEGFVVAAQSLLNVFLGSTYFSPIWCPLVSAEGTKCTTNIGLQTSRTKLQSTALAGMLLLAANDTYNQLWSIADTFAFAGAGGMAKDSAGPPVITPSDRELSRNMSLSALIEEMSRNVTLSLFTQGDYLSHNTSAAVTTTAFSNRYTYNSRNLILAYAIAFSISALCVIIGLFAYYANGLVSCNASFSAILCATRNTVLDILARQYYRGPFVVAPEFRETKLRLGFFQHRALSEDTAHAVMGFGVSGQVAESKKGYSRLKAS